MLYSLVAILSLVYGAILFINSVSFIMNVSTPYSLEYHIFDVVMNFGSEPLPMVGLLIHIMAHAVLPILLVIFSIILLTKGLPKSLLVTYIILTALEIIADVTLNSSTFSMVFKQSGFRPSFLYTILGGVGIVLTIVTIKLPGFIYPAQNEQATATTIEKSETVASEIPTATTIEKSETVASVIPTATTAEKSETVASETTTTNETAYAPVMESAQTTATLSESAPVVNPTPVVKPKPKKKKAMSEKKAAIRKTVIEWIIATAVVSALAIGISAIFNYIGAGLLLSLIMCLITIFYIIPSSIISINRSFCSECGAHYDYDNEIRWEVTREENTGDDIYDYVDFECYCSNCGKIRQFQIKFKVAYYDKKKNAVIRNNIQTLVRNYFYKK